MLTLKSLQAGYGPLPVLKGISLHVRAGEVVTLIGGNGAGKTTTLRTISGLLPPRTEFVVLPDPEGPRIGSGGATLRSLGLSTARHPQPTARRTLIIHSGGDARRLPHCSAPGKLFARIPRTLPDGRASTVFDEFLISLCGLAEALPPGALVASGDVLLVFDHLQLVLQGSRHIQGILHLVSAIGIQA